MKIFGIVGWKNSGKTGLVERLVDVISARGFSVSTIKHAHHTFDVDKMGKDSYRHRQAGAREVLLSSKNRWALMSELRGVNEASLSSLISKLSPVDLVLIEGYKRDNHSKIEAHRLETRQPLLAREDETIIALASNAINMDVVIPIFNLDNTDGIADFILKDQFDLVLCKGILIHINPDQLSKVYEKIYKSCKQYILIAEYYSTKPIKLTYRNHEEKLFKRDFAGELLQRYKKLKLINYGFSYHKDKYPQDDITWFLLKKN